MKIWKECGLLSNASFESIQHQVDSFNLPAGIGRIPGKTAAGFADFTAEQWKTWTIIVYPYVLCNVLPHDHYALWCIYSEVCSILCRPILHVSHIHWADDLLVEFCRKYTVKRSALPIYALALPPTRICNRCGGASVFVLVLLVRTI